MTNAPEGAFKIPNFIDQLELAKFGHRFTNDVVTRKIMNGTSLNRIIQS